MKYKKHTPGHNKLLNLFNDLSDIILTDKTLESENQENENENVYDENENEDEYENEDDDDKTMSKNEKKQNKMIKEKK